MSSYFVPIEQQTTANSFFRKVLFTGKQSQLVLMCLQPGEEIGLETHPENDQFFRFESGEGLVIAGDEKYEVTDGDAVVIVAGTQHNIINTSTTKTLHMYTLYSPAHHAPDTIHATKEEAEAAELTEQDDEA
jgi:mannose-6-phosphate isomerase-like protein (cupin superfamily)